MDDSLARSLMGALLCGIALTNQAGFADDDVVATAPLVETSTVFAEDLAANPLDAIEKDFDEQIESSLDRSLQIENLGNLKDAEKIINESLCDTIYEE